ncbi:SdpI family protein [Virgibacillus sp. CBA3643]|uniref:SdpI family protein n=1 Tax=Virgibacillus sp. CBA3643 TaxID=2942278 RepID=UPI0035A34CDE
MENIFVAVINITCGLLFVCLGIPFYKERVKMNHLYGVKFNKSFESEENWYKINKYCVKRLMIWSIPLLFIGIIAIFLPPLNEFLMIMFTFAPCIVLIPAIESYIYSKKF